MPAPEAHLAHVADAHARLLAAIEGLGDEAVRRPSLLPGWSVAHVLTHVARNADSHVRRAEAAVRGEVVDQYPGGAAGRVAEIEEGSTRSAGDLIDDVARSARAVEEAWRDVPDEAWAATSRDVGGSRRPLFELPARRWQEVEVHLVDLSVGVSHRDWPDEFVVEWLPRLRNFAAGRLPGDAWHARFDHPADELAWLYGRLRRDDLPDPPPWG